MTKDMSSLSLRFSWGPLLKSRFTPGPGLPRMVRSLSLRHQSITGLSTTFASSHPRSSQTPKRYGVRTPTDRYPMDFQAPAVEGEEEEEAGGEAGVEAEVVRAMRVKSTARPSGRRPNGTRTSRSPTATTVRDFPILPNPACGRSFPSEALDT
jgi:hypothetical protein